MSILVVSHFGLDGGSVVLIAPVPGHCLPFTCHKFITHLCTGNNGQVIFVAYFRVSFCTVLTFYVSR